MSTLDALRQAVEAHAPWDADEAAMREKLLIFLDDGPKILWRSHLVGHITASAWVVDFASESALLIHHRKLSKWLQPGGHADGDADTLAVAQREVSEETGLQTLPVSTAIFDIDIHPIPARGSEPEHLHYDLRYLLQPEAGAHLQPNAEVHAAEWIQLSRVHQLNQERSVLRMVEKSLALSQNPSRSI